LPRILIVEDEPAISESLAYALKRDGFEVSQAGTLIAARAILASAELVLLDLMLPDGSGFDISPLRAARSRARACRHRPLEPRPRADRVAALETGADDYVTKPFSPREVVARVRAVLRGPGPETARACAEADQRSPPLVVDEATRRARSRPSDRAHAGRVRSARLPALRPRARLHARAAHRSRVGRRLRDHRSHHRLPREGPAPEGLGGGRRRGPHRDRARRRLPRDRSARARSEASMLQRLLARAHRGVGLILFVAFVGARLRARAYGGAEHPHAGLPGPRRCSWARSRWAWACSCWIASRRARRCSPRTRRVRRPPLVAALVAERAEGPRRASRPSPGARRCCHPERRARRHAAGPGSTAAVLIPASPEYRRAAARGTRRREPDRVSGARSGRCGWSNRTLKIQRTAPRLRPDAR
jgi:DNA-binding response OmpR family regulator